MEKVFTPSLTLDDIVFENRNQAYGAYDLRASYQRNMTRALTLAPLLLLLVVGTPVGINYLLQWLLPVEFINPTTLPAPSTPLKFDKIEIILEKRVGPPPAPIKSVRSVQMEVVKDDLVDPKDQPPTTAMLQDAVAGPLTIDGPGDDIPPLEIADGTGEGTGAPAEVVAENKEFLVVEEMPEFPGGQAALLKFIGKHLRYPSSAQAKGISGVVYVTFVINPEGQVTKVEVLKGIETACDAEAARVINKMPAWKPGRQSGRNVPVRYSLPIRFAMQ